MGSKLYVGNLSYNVTSSDLEQLFGAHGTVQSAEVIADRETGRSKGFGFVQMGNDTEAAIGGVSLLNGKQHVDTTLVIRHDALRCVSRERFRSGCSRACGRSWLSRAPSTAASSSSR